MDKNLERLLRIMGTFDLATGHAETIEEALDSLESELRDVLGFYRKKHHQYHHPESRMTIDPNTGNVGIVVVGATRDHITLDPVTGFFLVESKGE